MPHAYATEILRQTSRTFYVSIVRLPPQLQEAVMAAYLSLRAIDEIEDHPEVDKRVKVNLLLAISRRYQDLFGDCTATFSTIFADHWNYLPEVTTSLDQWSNLAPKAVAPLIWDASSRMAQRMAYWVENNWRMLSSDDLDNYTFDVAGTVGMLLSNLWMWYDGTTTSRNDAIGFGRGLQAVNILRNRAEDLERGVDLFPPGWQADDLQRYARNNLSQADAYVAAIQPGPIKEFCRVPLALAYATLDALGRGESKLSRDAVLQLIRQQDKRSGSNLNNGRRLYRNEEVVLVNEKDQVIGVEEKLKAHLRGNLHRAFSVFIFNPSGQLLMQKRSSTKYHSRGLWSNTCCGHPRPGESAEAASRRRLREEMGFDCELKKISKFVYKAVLEDGISEHEYDYVLVGEFGGVPIPRREEVDDWKWIDLPALKSDLEKRPDTYTYWFKIALNEILQARVVAVLS